VKPHALICEFSGVGKVKVLGCLGTNGFNGVETENQWWFGDKAP